MTAKVIVVTGISGSGSKEFCKRYAQRPNSYVYNTGGMMENFALEALRREIPRANFLNLHPDSLSLLEFGVYRKIANDLKSGVKDRYDRIIIDAHAMFKWNSTYRESLKEYMLEDINPNLFITIIDKPSSVKERQLQTEQGRAQNHDLAQLLEWMQHEAIASERMARLSDVSHCVFSSKQNPESVESLLGNKFLIYSSFPMTNASPEATAKIVEFKATLREMGKRLGLSNFETPVIDPADIDIETGAGLENKERDAIGRYTILRDLEWDVGRATHIIAYYPDAETDLSAGVTHECVRALETGKNVYLITPREKISPFLESSAIKKFKTRAAFLEFFDVKFKEDWANLARK
jgi:adenylate kinase